MQFILKKLVMKQKKKNTFFKTELKRPLKVS